MQQDKKYRLIFFGTWLIIGLAQAALTDITPDEAYYYMYSRDLAWGYFDHPPVVALLVKLGYSIFPNQLGVRLFPVLLGTLSIFIFEKVVKPSNVGLFYIFTVSVGILHFMGFFAIPDSPLMFFTAAFFWLYRKFLNHPGLKWAIILGLCSALMMLSKYHAILIIGFTVLSNLKLLRQRNFWLVVLVFLLAISPHLYWQFENGFTSFRYQLIERAGDPYQLRYTTEYLSTFLFILGPVVSLIMFLGTALLPTKDRFERALKFCFWGVYIFFFFSSFNGWVEGHWVMITLVPGLYFGYRITEKRGLFKRIVKIQFLPIILLILAARFVVAFDVLPHSGPLNNLNKRYHGKEEWVNKIREKAGNTPVVFLSSYKNPSLYTFYTGIESTSFNTIFSRKNQFSIWNYEEELRGKDVVVIPNYNKTLEDSVLTSFGRLDLDYISNYNPVTNIWLEPLNFPQEATAGDTLNVRFRLQQKGPVDLMANSAYPPTLMYMFYDLSKEVSAIYEVKNLNNEMLDAEFNAPVVVPDYPGEIKFKAGVQSGWIPPGYHSDWQKIKITPADR